MEILANCPNLRLRQQLSFTMSFKVSPVHNLTSIFQDLVHKCHLLHPYMTFYPCFAIYIDNTFNFALTCLVCFSFCLIFNTLFICYSCNHLQWHTFQSCLSFGSICLISHSTWLEYSSLSRSPSLGIFLISSCIWSFNTIHGKEIENKNILPCSQDNRTNQDRNLFLEYNSKLFL